MARRPVIPDLPLVRIQHGNAFDLTVDPDEWRRVRAEQAARSRIQQHDLAELAGQNSTRQKAGGGER